jgi:hypothetical protein
LRESRHLADRSFIECESLFLLSLTEVPMPICPNCSKPVGATDKSCPYCDTPIEVPYSSAVRTEVYEVLDGLVEKHGQPIRELVHEWFYRTDPDLCPSAPREDSDLVDSILEYGESVGWGQVTAALAKADVQTIVDRWLTEPRAHMWESSEARPTPFTCVFCGAVRER